MNPKHRSVSRGFAWVALLALGLVLWGCGDDPATPTSADLVLTKLADVSAANEGATVTYTLALSNVGPGAASAVQVTDLLPAGMTFVSATASVGSYVDATGIWSVGSLAVNASASLTITATIDAGTLGSIVTNTASVTATSVGDPSTANNTAAATVTVGQLGAGVQANAVHLQWQSGSGVFKLIRKRGTAPVSADDPQADIVYEGAATSVDDPLTNLLPAVDGVATVYYYGLYDCANPPCSTIAIVEVRPTLVQCLRAGGYTIFWRHADADVCADNLALGTAATTTVPNWWRTCDANCTTTNARQLNAAGVANATLIGQQFDAKSIPVGRVLSSEYCRCFRTAELMDFGPAIEQDQGLTYFVYDEANRCTSCQNHLAVVPAAGTNTAMIGHAGFSPACPIIGGLAWSECAIFKPQVGGPAQFVQRVLAGQWATLP